MNRTKAQIVNWLLVFLWAAVIFTFSSMKQVKVSEFFFWDFAAKKAAHFSEYAILYYLLFKSTGKNYLMAFILTMVYSITDEIHQSFVPGRTPAIYDVAIDFTGTASSAYIIWKLKLLKRHKPRK